MNWRLHAACVGTDTAVFFNEDDPGPALALCAICLVRQQCLDAGITGREEGVWGGRVLVPGRSAAAPLCPRCGRAKQRRDGLCGTCGTDRKVSM